MARGEDDGRNPWTRPVVLVSGVLIVAVVVLGVWLAVANERRSFADGDGVTASQTQGADDGGSADGGGGDDGGASGEGDGDPAGGDAADGASDGGDGSGEGEAGDGAGGSDGSGSGGNGSDGAGPDGTGTATDGGVAVVPGVAPGGTGDAGDGSPSACGLGPAVLGGTVTRAPDGARWELVGTVAAPRIDGVGPGVVAPDGFRSCYAQSPTGALLAAANVVAMGAVEELVPRMTAELTVPGPGRDAALERLAAEEAAATATPSAPAGRTPAPTATGARTTATPTTASGTEDSDPEGTDPDGTPTATPSPTPLPPTPAIPRAPARYQIRGFDVISYTGGQATVDLALGLDNGALGSFVVDLVWLEGDWHVRLSDAGTLLTPPAQIPNLAGYTVWSGA